MWVRIQAKSKLINVNMIEVSKVLTRKSKSSVLGLISNSNEMYTTLGVYDSEEAERIFEEMEQAILVGKKLFVMP